MELQAKKYILQTWLLTTIINRNFLFFFLKVGGNTWFQVNIFILLLQTRSPSKSNKRSMWAACESYQNLVISMSFFEGQRIPIVFTQAISIWLKVADFFIARQTKEFRSHLRIVTVKPTFKPKKIVIFTTFGPIWSHVNYFSLFKHL